MKRSNTTVLEVEQPAVKQPTQHKLESIMEDVSRTYNIGKELGYGRYGIVRLVSKKSFERKRFALKTISRTLMLSKGQSSDSTPLLENEFEILKSVDHPNIIKFYEIY